MLGPLPQSWLDQTGQRLQPVNGRVLQVRVKRRRLARAPRAMPQACTEGGIAMTQIQRPPDRPAAHAADRASDMAVRRRLAAYGVVSVAFFLVVASVACQAVYAPQDVQATIDASLATVEAVESARETAQPRVAAVTNATKKVASADQEPQAPVVSGAPGDIPATAEPDQSEPARAVSVLPGPVLDPSEISKKSLVLVSAHGSFGAGVVLKIEPADQTVLIVTSHRLVGTSGQVSITPASSQAGPPLDATLVAFSERRDLAVLRVCCAGGLIEAQTNGTDGLIPGDPVFLLSYSEADAGQPEVTRGFLNAVVLDDRGNRLEIQTDLRREGVKLSGPVFGDQGRLVGFVGSPGGFPALGPADQLIVSQTSSIGPGALAVSSLRQPNNGAVQPAALPTPTPRPTPAPSATPELTPTTVALPTQAGADQADQNRPAAETVTPTIAVQPTALPTAVPPQAPTATPEHTPTPPTPRVPSEETMVSPVLKIHRLELQHLSNSDKIVQSGTTFMAADFVATGEFENPFSGSNRVWNYGLTFRGEGDDFLILSVHGNKRWTLHHRSGRTDKLLQEGGSDLIRTDLGESNLIGLVAYGYTGWLLINGQFVAKLDIGAKTAGGSTTICTGAFVNDEYNLAQLAVNDFFISRLTPVRALSSLDLTKPGTGPGEKKLDVSVSEFLLEVNFTAPYPAYSGDWSLGIGYRLAEQQGDWLEFDDTKSVVHKRYQQADPTNVALAAKTVTAIALEPELSNRLLLLVVDDLAVLLVNGEPSFFPTLTGASELGDIWMRTGLKDSHQPGYSTTSFGAINVLGFER